MIASSRSGGGVGSGSFDATGAPASGGDGRGVPPALPDERGEWEGPVLALECGLFVGFGVVVGLGVGRGVGFGVGVGVGVGLGVGVGVGLGVGVGVGAMTETVLGFTASKSTVCWLAPLPEIARK